MHASVCITRLLDAPYFIALTGTCCRMQFAVVWRVCEGLLVEMVSDSRVHFILARLPRAQIQRSGTSSLLWNLKDGDLSRTGARVPIRLKSEPRAAEAGEYQAGCMSVLQLIRGLFFRLQRPLKRREEKRRE